jgi:ankyrin repeat protein
MIVFTEISPINKKLLQAVINGDAELVRVLLNSGANVTAKNNYNWTPLHFAAKNGYTEIVIDLLDKGADVNATANYEDDPNGTQPSITALHLAAQNEHAETVRALLNHSADVNAKDWKNKTPLHLAAYRGPTSIVIDLLNKGADLNATANFGYDTNGTPPSFTALHLAAINGRAGTVRALLSYGADASAQDRFGDTPLHDGVKINRIDVVKVIISNILHNNAVLSIKNRANRTALDIAKYNGYSDIVAVLSNAGASRKKKRNAAESELQQ